MENRIMNQTTKQPTEIFAASIATILDAVGEEHDREREIIVRRFGLKERRETLEQIGELLGITRERVRQLEKAIVVRLKLAAEAGELEGLHDAERLIIRDLSENGRVGRVSDITQRLLDVETPTVPSSAKSQPASPPSTRPTNTTKAWPLPNTAMRRRCEAVWMRSLPPSNSMARPLASKRCMTNSPTRTLTKCAASPASLPSWPTSKICGA